MICISRNCTLANYLERVNTLSSYHISTKEGEGMYLRTNVFIGEENGREENSFWLVFSKAYLTMILFSISFFCFLNESEAAQARALTLDWSWTDQNCKNAVNNVDLNAEYYGDLWLDVMDNHYDTRTLDGTIFAAEVTDASLVAWGEDHTDANLDDGDATLLVTHGGSNVNYYWIAALTTDNGNGAWNGDCQSYSTQMEVGDNDAEFFHTLSCRSACWGIVYDSTNGYHLMADALHQFGGFHGTANTGNWNKVNDFAEDAWTSADSVAWAWIENLTYFDYFGENKDLCAVNISKGNDDTHALSRANYEDYGSGYADTDGDGDWYRFYCGCDPVGNHADPHTLPAC